MGREVFRGLLPSKEQDQRGVYLKDLKSLPLQCLEETKVCTLQRQLFVGCTIFDPGGCLRDMHTEWKKDFSP